MADATDNLLKALKKASKREGGPTANTPPSRGHILTFTGKFINPIRADKDDLDIIDIAHALSNTARYGGHSRTLYSVAQHSVMVASMLPKDLALTGLLHDAAEAYLGDVPTPIKRQSVMRGFREAEDRLLKLILEKYVGRDSYTWPLAPEIGVADRRALRIEMAALMPPMGQPVAGAPTPTLPCWEPAQARDVFLKVYAELSGVKVSSPNKASK